MSRKHKLRLDTLRSDYDVAETATSHRDEGPCQKLVAFTSSILGVVTLVSSVLLLRDQRLEMNRYWYPESSLYRTTFPVILLACAATNTASSILQIVGSLMFLFQDIGGNIWRWLNFTIWMISGLSLLELEKEEEYPPFPLYHFHFVALAINCALSTLFIFCSMCCFGRQRH